MAGQGPDRYRDDVTRKLPYLYPLRMTRNGVAWPGHIPDKGWGILIPSGINMEGSEGVSHAGGILPEG